MKLITYYTDSHKKMLDEYFLPSLEKINFNMDDLYIKCGNQYDSDGSFTHPEFHTIMTDKLKFIFDSLLMFEKEEFICYSDVDIQFFRNFVDDFNENYELYNKYDIIGQNDYPIDNKKNIICAGFMYIKNTEKNHKFFKKLIKNINKKKFLSNKLKFTGHDQHCLNYYKNDVKTHLLDINKYFNIASVTNCKKWESNQTNFDIPKNIIMHHANWTIGVENKLSLLELIKNKNI